MGAPPVVQEGLFNSTSSEKSQEKKANPPAEGEEFNLPKTSKSEKKTPHKGEEGVKAAQEELKKKEAKGFRIPSVLKKIWEYTNKAADIVVMVVGVPLKYVGLCFLVVGAIHFIVILCTAAPPLLLAGGGIMSVLFVLIKSGALPTIIAGATLYKFGSDLIKNESFPSLNLIPWVLPLPFYQWLSMTKPPSPMDQH